MKKTVKVRAFACVIALFMCAACGNTANTSSDSPNVTEVVTTVTTTTEATTTEEVSITEEVTTTEAEVITEAQQEETTTVKVETDETTVAETAETKAEETTTGEASPDVNVTLGNASEEVVVTTANANSDSAYPVTEKGPEQEPFEKDDDLILLFKSEVDPTGCGCEIATAVAVLNYYGFSCSKEELLSYLDVQLEPDENGLWNSPNDVYLGNPTLVNGEEYQEGNRDSKWYGCYAGALEKAINNYFTSQNVTDYEAINISGCTPEEIYSEVSAGNPVIFWWPDATGFESGAPVYSDTIKLKDGSEIVWIDNYVARAVVGFRKNDETIMFSGDKLAKKTISTKSLFEKDFVEYGAQAVVIKKK